jgi:hypothetical protein
MDNACGLLFVSEAGPISSLSLPPLPKVLTGRLDAWPAASAGRPTEIRPVVLSRPLPQADKRRFSLTPARTARNASVSQIRAPTGLIASNTAAAFCPLPAPPAVHRAGLSLPMVTARCADLNT